jgi:hypothetical protein
VGTIRVERFLGIAPKIAAHLLANSQAQTARNTKLWSQGLRPVNGMSLGPVLSKLTGDIQTLFRYKANTDWLCWTQDVNAVLGPVNNDTLEKLYFTGTDKPRVTTNVLYDDGTPGTSVPPASWILGIPAPTSAPVATDSAVGVVTGDLLYVFTFVRKYSDNWVEESAPSPVSNKLSALTNRQTSVTLPNGAITTGDYGITHKRLYRSTSGSNYFLVAEVAIGTSPTTDNVAVASLGDAIETIDYLPPPDGMKGMITLPNGVLAGFMDNVVYLSDPYRPHAYPQRNQYAVHRPIIGLGNVGTTVVVITQGQVEIGRGVDPAAYSFVKRPGIFPCTSKRSIASTDVGVLWSTPRGMALCDGIQVLVATAEFLTKEEWTRDFYPDTIHGVVHAGRYYGWFQTGTDDGGRKVGGGFVLDKTEEAFLTTTSEYVYAAHTIPESDELHVVRKNPSFTFNNYVYKWEGDPGTPMQYTWHSKTYITPGADNFCVAQVIGKFGVGLSIAELAAITAAAAAVRAANALITTTDGPLNGAAADVVVLNGDSFIQTPPTVPATAVTFKYYADGVLQKSIDVGSSDPFPLPGGFLGEEHEFEISGSAQIESVQLATSYEELATV